MKLDLSDLGVKDLPEGYTPLAAVAAVKCLDEDGHVTWVTRCSEDLHTVECAGAATVLADVLRQSLVERWEED